jgi:NAD(P)-dependent dehydrogenase (short-subunit alcohol dehydrogenase family)
MTRWTPSDLPDQTGRTALVTGANSGLGFQTSLELARHGARVLMACRNPARAEDALGRLRLAVPNASAELVSLDLSSLDSVERAAEDVGSRVVALDVLVNNAGIMAVPAGKTADGFEMQLGTNHLGHFALTGRLMPLLLATPGARVVTVSSGAHAIGKIHFEDLQAENGYDRWRRYGQSKLANLLFTSELQKRAAGGVLAVAAHPGYASTHLQEGQGQPFFEALMKVGNVVLAQSDAQGAWPSLYAATMPSVSGNDYYGPNLLGLRGYPVKTWRTGAAKNAADAARLWNLSEDLTKVTYTFSTT